MGLQAGSGFVKTAGEWVFGRLVVPKAVHQNDRECLLKTDIPRLHQTDQLLLFCRHCVRATLRDPVDAAHQASLSFTIS